MTSAVAAFAGAMGDSGDVVDAGQIHQKELDDDAQNRDAADPRREPSRLELLDSAAYRQSSHRSASRKRALAS